MKDYCISRYVVDFDHSDIVLSSMIGDMEEKFPGCSKSNLKWVMDKTTADSIITSGKVDYEITLNFNGVDILRINGVEVEYDSHLLCFAGGYVKLAYKYDECYLNWKVATRPDLEIRRFYPAPQFKKVIFNDPATIVYWTDGTKTVVECQDGDIFDREKGLSMAFMKKCLGNKGNFNNEIKKWI